MIKPHTARPIMFSNVHFEIKIVHIYLAQSFIKLLPPKWIDSCLQLFTLSSNIRINLIGFIKAPANNYRNII